MVHCGICAWCIMGFVQQVYGLFYNGSTLYHVILCCVITKLKCVTFELIKFHWFIKWSIMVFTDSRMIYLSFVMILLTFHLMVWDLTKMSLFLPFPWDDLLSEDHLSWKTIFAPILVSQSLNICVLKLRLIMWYGRWWTMGISGTFSWKEICSIVALNRVCQSLWWQLQGLLSWCPVFWVKSLQFIWRSGTRRFHLRVPDLQMSFRDLTTW